MQPLTSPRHARTGSNCNHLQGGGRASAAAVGALLIAISVSCTSEGEEPTSLCEQGGPVPATTAPVPTPDAARVAMFPTDPVSAEVPPPPISGGTLIVTRDGKLAIASDPDRDVVYLVDVASAQLTHTLTLAPKDEPGRLVEDAHGRIHVALRGGRSIVSFPLATPTQLTRRVACDLPRGLAYDAKQELVHVACAEGALVSLSADPTVAAPSRKLDLGRDLRDVVVHDGELFVTRFRSAKLLRLDARGRVTAESAPTAFWDFGTPADDESALAVPAMRPSRSTACGPVGFDLAPPQTLVSSTPSVAWRALDVPGRGVMLLHQRAQSGLISTQLGGYGQSGGKCGPGIVHSAVTLASGVEGRMTWSADLDSSALAVDIAITPAGDTIAVAAPGSSSSAVMLYGLSEMDPATTAPPTEGVPSAPVSDCAFGFRALLDGPVTAVAYTPEGVLVAQQREPAKLTFVNAVGVTLSEIDLKQPSRADSGHQLFHTVAGANIACASCHPEGGDDGHVWTFQSIGPRRTQYLRGGILGTEPLHWNGDMADFDRLMNDVFTGRMQGFLTSAEQTATLARWVDAQPRFEVTARDPDAVARGQALFESEAVGCTSCHSGPLLTNNASADVGTGALLQVPALRGVSFRTPLMHDGCATELSDRFGECGGGDAHGHTSQLDDAELADLTAYLEVL